MSTLEKLAGTPAPPPSQRKPVAGVDVITYNASLDHDAHKFLPYVWNRMREDGLVDIYFPDGAQTGFSDFVKLMSGGAQILLLVERTATGDLDRMVGFATWTPLALGASRAAVVGFIIFKEFWDAQSSTTAALRGLRYWFQEGGLQIAVGLVADLNLVTQRFLTRIGWTRLGTMPYLGLYHGTACGGEFWYQTREQFERHTEANGHA